MVEVLEKSYTCRERKENSIERNDGITDGLLRGMREGAQATRVSIKHKKSFGNGPASAHYSCQNLSSFSHNNFFCFETATVPGPSFQLLPPLQPTMTAETLINAMKNSYSWLPL